MKNKTAIEWYQEIIEALEGMTKDPKKRSHVINGVDFVSISKLFIFMQSEGNNVHLYLNEISDSLCIRYKPVEGNVIFINSVKSKKFVPKINLINYN